MVTLRLNDYSFMTINSTSTDGQSGKSLAVGYHPQEEKRGGVKGESRFALRVFSLFSH